MRSKTIILQLAVQRLSVLRAMTSKTGRRHDGIREARYFHMCCRILSFARQANVVLQEEVQFVKSLFMDERGCWSALMLPKKAPEWFLGFSHEVKVCFVGSQV